MREKGKGGACGKAAKCTPTGEAGTPYKRKGAGRRKKAEKDRERRSGMHAQAMRSTARKRRSMEKKSGTCLMTEGAGTLQREHS